MSKELKIFYKQLKKDVAPVLEEQGFIFDKKRSFRRSLNVNGIEFIQIIEFQVGIKRLIGQFAINLGVYSSEFVPADWEEPHDLISTCNCLPKQNIRLGYLIEPHKSFFDMIFNRTPIPFDKWWKQSESEKKMSKTFNEIIELIFSKGINWLEVHSTISCIKESYEHLQKRRNIKV